MMRSSLILLTALLSAGCTESVQLRATSVTDRIFRLEDVEVSTPGDEIRTALAATSIERYDGFTLGVIELSDDGHVKDEVQHKQVLDEVRQRVMDGGLLVVFVHGWHHNASPCDTNLACFRRVLQEVHRDTSRKNNGPVVGVYLGWRGESIESDKFNFLSFYQRKRAAHEIGERSGAQVLLELAELYRDTNVQLKQAASRSFVSLIIVGHSFGGALVYSAVERALTSEWSGVDGVGPPPGPDGIKAKRERLGSLVILINPAFEAERYRLFDQDLREGKYSTQCPVLLTVSSEGDKPNRYAFPFGRTLWLAVHPQFWGRFGTERKSLGHYRPQVTHELKSVGAPAAKVPEGGSQCSCPFSTFEAEVLLRDNALRGFDAAHTGTGIPAANSNEPCAVLRDPEALGQRLPTDVALTTVRPNWDTGSPYWVLRADKNLIPDHSSIYGKSFVSFLITYLNLYLAQEPVRSQEAEP